MRARLGLPLLRLTVEAAELDNSTVATSCNSTGVGATGVTAAALAEPALPCAPVVAPPAAAPAKEMPAPGPPVAALGVSFPAVLPVLTVLRLPVWPVLLAAFVPPALVACAVVPVSSPGAPGAVAPAG